MKILRPIAVLSTIGLLILFINYEKWLHASVWKNEAVLRMSMLLFAAFPAVILFLEIWYWFDGKKPLFKYRIYFIIYLLFIALFLIINPLNIQYKPEIKYRGHWTGNGTAGNVIIYKDSTFLIQWEGLVRGGLYKGKWTGSDDSMHLEYAGRVLDRVGECLRYSNSMLIPLDGNSGFLLKSVYFKVDNINGNQ